MCFCLYLWRFTRCQERPEEGTGPQSALNCWAISLVFHRSFCGMKSRSSSMPGKHFATQPRPQYLFDLTLHFIWTHSIFLQEKILSQLGFWEQIPDSLCLVCVSPSVTLENMMCEVRHTFLWSLCDCVHSIIFVMFKCAVMGTDLWVVQQDECGRCWRFKMMDILLCMKFSSVVSG